MREIKFRAWSNARKSFVNISNENKDYKLIVDVPTENLFCEGSTDHGETDQPILLQFTGLKDKNGKEIFEGDIVLEAYTKSSNPSPHKKLIEWKYCGFEISQYNTEYEVIGNIYENPELIDNKNLLAGYDRKEVQRQQDQFNKYNDTDGMGNSFSDADPGL